MSVEVSELVIPKALERFHAEAQLQNLPYAGSVPPVVAQELSSRGEAVLVDVRSPEEYKFVGHVPGSLHVPWASGTSLIRNPRFVRELEARVSRQGGKEAVLLLLCRSGKRSALAAQAATKAGFAAVFNVQEGFEGDIDEAHHRGHKGGWRLHGLPWEQD